jgi:hypothetical protein
MPSSSSRDSHISKIITAATTLPHVPLVKNHIPLRGVILIIIIIIINTILEVHITPTCSAREALHLPTEVLIFHHQLVELA